MYYVVKSQPHRNKQLSYEDIIRGECAIPRNMYTKRMETGTVTRAFDEVPYDLVVRTPIGNFIEALETFVNDKKVLIDSDRRSLYRTFYIPKKSGGLRKIDAPNDELKKALYDLKYIMETYAGRMHHTAAYAYIGGRSTLMNVQLHQRNESKWFLKTDLTNFFGSTTQDFILKMLSMIFPYSHVMRSWRGKSALTKAISLCMLDGGLPQGTPISPMLTNLIMIPMDHEISNYLRKEGCIYTRYADDMMISSKRSFLFTEKIAYLNSVFQKFGAPYEIKKEKTRYGSSSGANWILGVMLNKDGNITIGHKKKDMYRAMYHQFIMDLKEGNGWDIGELQHFAGLISYYKMVEPEYVKKVNEDHIKKFGVDVQSTIKELLRR